MFVERFMAWSVSVGSSQRSKAICQLAEKFLSGTIAECDYSATEQILVLYLSDPCPKVRGSLATAIADSDHAPRVLVWGLSQDIVDVSTILFEKSPMLKESDLIQAVAKGEVEIQSAIANREAMSGDVVRALVETANEKAVLELLNNPNIVLGPGLVHDIADRLGHVVEIRTFLLEKSDISPACRQLLVQRLSNSMFALVSDNGWCDADRLEETTVDATNCGTIEIARQIDNEQMGDFVLHLLETEQLTPALLVRAICEGNAALFENALSVVSGVSLKRVQAIIDAGKTSALKALYGRTGLPANSFSVVNAALAAWRNASPDESVLMNIISILDGEEDEVDGTLFAMLSRMITEEHAQAAKTYDRQLLLAA